MSEIDVAVVRTGTANLASVLAGLRRVGAKPRVAEGPKDVEVSERLVMPGVGTLAAAMERLNKERLVEPLRERIASGRPTLAICLGLQMLCEESEENPGLEALGAAPAKITRFPENQRVPQLGWNLIEPDADCALLERGYAYFANSYRLERCPSGWAAAMSDYGGPFVAAMERGPVLACQFHPELSGELGTRLIRRWIEIGEKEGEGKC